jgi:protein-S-isoprenylcysteine O-methyltransferase Ste14
VLRAGGFVLVVGMLVTLVAMLPLVTDLALPSLFWWLSMLLVGSGLALVLLGLFRNGRSRSRMQRAARVPSDG